MNTIWRLTYYNYIILILFHVIHNIHLQTSKISSNQNENYFDDEIIVTCFGFDFDFGFSFSKRILMRKLASLDRFIARQYLSED